MASINELNITNMVKTAQNTSIPRWTFTLHVVYTDDAGVQRTYGPTTHTWPNDLTGVPDDYLKARMSEIIFDKVRVQLGVASWENVR